MHRLFLENLLSFKNYYYISENTFSDFRLYKCCKLIVGIKKNKLNFELHTDGYCHLKGIINCKKFSTSEPFNS